MPVWAKPFPNEPPEAWAAFCAWLIDPRRTHPRAWARDRGFEALDVEAWARTFAWAGRAASYRAELDHEAAKLALALRVHGVRVRLDAVLAASAGGRLARARLEHLAAEAEAAPGAVEVSAKDAAALARNAREELAALDPPSGEAAPAARDLSALTDEELDTLDTLEEKVRRGATAR